MYFCFVLCMILSQVFATFMLFFFFFKQKTAYELRISDWSSDVCSPDLRLSNMGWTSFQTAAISRRLAARDRRHKAVLRGPAPKSRTKHKPLRTRSIPRDRKSVV